MFAKENIIIVTGASSGIGKGGALYLNSLGATIIACGRSGAKLSDAQEKSSYPENWHNHVFDLIENIDSIPTWINELRQQYGKFYGLAHCAGEGVMDNLQLYDLQKARDHFDLNFHVPMLLAKAFTDRRNCVKGASIVFTSSSSALFPEKGHLLYGAAKSALATASKVISQEVVGRGIRVNCIAPGIVDTPLQEEAENIMGAQYRDEQLARYPLGFADVQDIAEMVAFLLSEKARWITGQNYIMGGGYY